MKLATKLPSTFSWLLSGLVLLCGCGGGAGTSYSSPPSGPTSGPPAQGQDISGNWQFSTTSTADMPPLTIAGSILQSGTWVIGAVHVDGGSCFDQMKLISMTGAITDGNVSLTSTSVDGQVITFAGSITIKSGAPDTLTGTYAINGGCANGEQGNVTGFSVGPIADIWLGNLTTAGGATIHMSAKLRQESASPEGSFGLTGTITFDDACFKSGKITSGTFPSASFIMGASVVLDIKTDNGTIAFRATADQTGVITGNYTVSGGPCEPNGTGYLSPWDF